MKNVIFSALLIVIAVIITACAPSEVEQAPRTDDGNQTLDQDEIEAQKSGQACADYSRDGRSERHCTTCGDGICETYERCTSSSCSGGLCTSDCGPLYCTQDCGPESQKPAPTESLPEAQIKLRICRKDDECIKVQADCCGCTAGGKATSIHEQYSENWQDTIESKCAEIMCPAVMSNHWTCAAEARCIGNKCTLEP